MYSITLLNGIVTAIASYFHAQLHPYLRGWIGSSCSFRNDPKNPTLELHASSTANICAWHSCISLHGSCKPPSLPHPNTNPHCRRLRLNPSAELLTTNKLSELACLALYLCYEKKQGRSSFWLPFIQELDRQRGRGSSAAESPLLWEPEEVEYFKGSPMKVRT